MRVMLNIKPEHLLFIAFFATMPIYSPNLLLFANGFPESSATMDAFVRSMLIATTVAALLEAFLSFRTPKLPGNPALISVAALCSIAGPALLAFALAADGEAGGGGALASLGGAFAGFGLVAISIAWATILSAYNLRQSLFWIGVMVGCASLVEMLLSAVALPVGLLVFMVLTCMGIALPVWKAWKHALDMPEKLESQGIEQLPEREEAFAASSESGIEQASDEAFSVGANEGLAKSLKQMAALLAVPLVGLMVLALMLSVRRFVAFNLINAEVIGGLIGAVLVAPLAFLRKANPLLPFIHQLLIPLFALFLITLNSFPEATGPLWLAGWLSYVLYAAVGILAIASLNAMAHAKEFSPALIFGMTLASFAVMSMVGRSVGLLPLMQYQDGGPVLLVVSTFYFAFLLAVPLFTNWRHYHERREEPVPTADTSKRCRELAQAHGLSPRETQILDFLGRGHGVTYIANMLVLSESTVRTHVKSIYRKLGVSSREEVVSLVEQRSD